MTVRGGRAVNRAAQVKRACNSCRSTVKYFFNRLFNLRNLNFFRTKRFYHYRNRERYADCIRKLHFRTL